MLICKIVKQLTQKTKVLKNKNQKRILSPDPLILINKVLSMINLFCVITFC